jgi:hypothetical protein
MVATDQLDTVALAGQDLEAIAIGQDEIAVRERGQKRGGDEATTPQKAGRGVRESAAVGARMRASALLPGTG